MRDRSDSHLRNGQRGQARLGRGRILYVEDEPALAEMYSFGLRLAGYAVSTASTGAAGLSLARGDCFDAVLLDMQLPDMTGLAVLEELREIQTRSLPVGILSNLTDPELEERARRLGARWWLLKSRTTPRAVVEAVDSWVLDGREMTA